MMIESVASFEQIVGEIREIIVERGEETFPDADFSIKVPSGPIEHW
jgi:hypothetical protein